jgi:hypothetical protein
VTLPPRRPIDHGVSEIIQNDPHVMRPHPTVMQVLNDAGVARFEQATVDDLLAEQGVQMLCLRAEARPQPRVRSVTPRR